MKFIFYISVSGLLALFTPGGRKKSKADIEDS